MLIFSVSCAVFAVLSAINFIMYGVDKMQAKRGGQRIPEKTLLAASLLGGGVGGLVGMTIFRHKTRHGRFVLANVLGTIIQAAILITLAIFRL